MGKLTANKAKQILTDKEVHGQPLTDKQKKFFGAIAGGAKPYKAEQGGWLDNYAKGGTTKQQKLEDFYGRLFENISEGKDASGKVNLLDRVSGSINTVLEKPGQALELLFAKKKKLSDPYSNPYGVNTFSEVSGNTKKTWFPNRYIDEGTTTVQTTRPPKPKTYYDIEGKSIPSGWTPLTPELAKGKYSGSLEGMYYHPTGSQMGTSAISYWGSPKPQPKPQPILKPIGNERKSSPSPTFNIPSILNQLSYIARPENKYMVSYTDEEGVGREEGFPTYQLADQYMDWRRANDMFYGTSMSRRGVFENGGDLKKHQMGGYVYPTTFVPQAENGIEGTMGGLTDKGFNFNPSWGGAWRNGGTLQPPMAGANQTLPMYEAGGNIPGSVGFTYARTQGIPSEGPYAKKTMPSAQNGKEMQFYQQGLDWTPRNISKNGSVVKDNNGYWNPDNWGKVVEIDSPNITMQGVNQDLIGISDTGDVQYMTPGNDYQFEGNKVTEYPVAEDGISVNRADEYPLKKLDNLLNFTNYNKPKAKTGWLSKYE